MQFPVIYSYLNILHITPYSTPILLILWGLILSMEVISNKRQFPFIYISMYYFNTINEACKSLSLLLKYKILAKKYLPCEIDQITHTYAIYCDNGYFICKNIHTSLDSKLKLHFYISFNFHSQIHSLSYMSSYPRKHLFLF